LHTIGKTTSHSSQTSTHVKRHASATLYHATHAAHGSSKTTHWVSHHAAWLVESTLLSLIFLWSRHHLFLLIVWHSTISTTHWWVSSTHVWLHKLHLLWLIHSLPHVVTTTTSLVVVESLLTSSHHLLVLHVSASWSWWHGGLIWHLWLARLSWLLWHLPLWVSALL